MDDNRYAPSLLRRALGDVGEYNRLAAAGRQDVERRALTAPERVANLFDAGHLVRTKRNHCAPLSTTRTTSAAARSRSRFGGTAMIRSSVASVGEFLRAFQRR